MVNGFESRGSECLCSPAEPGVNRIRTDGHVLPEVVHCQALTTDDGGDLPQLLCDLVSVPASRSASRDTRQRDLLIEMTKTCGLESLVPATEPPAKRRKTNASVLGERSSAVR